MIAYLLALFGYRLARLTDDATNRAEREAAGAMIVYLALRWGIPPYLPNNTNDPQSAATFLASVGVDARGRRIVGVSNG